MKNKYKFIVALSALLCVTSLNINNQEVEVNAAIGETPKTNYSSELSEDYYDSLRGLKGDELLEQLAVISYANHKYYNTYDEIRGGNAYSDADPNDPSKLIDFYTGWSIANDWDDGATWNREHVWCQSLSGSLFGTSKGAGSDIHHIRPLISPINTARNNAKYTDQNFSGSISLKPYQYNNQYTGCYNEGQNYWEPRDEGKGDVARILMYLYMHYSKEVSANSSNSYAGNLAITNIAYTSSQSASSSWEMLVYWNTLDPVDELEMNRNNYCASVTGLRNPFIDHPEFASMIWDTSYSGQGALIDQTGAPVNYLILSSSYENIKVGETYQIVPKTNIENPVFSYTSTDSSIASVSQNGLVSGVSDGTTTIKVTCGSMVKEFIAIIGDNKASEYVGTYERVTSLSELTAGDNIILVGNNSYNYYALSTNQKSNNREAVLVDVDDTKAYIKENVAQLVLKEGKVSNTFAFYDGSNYLYAASSSKNYLKSTTSLDNNGSFKITPSSANKFKIEAQGSYTRNSMRFNYNNGSPLFSCYANTSTMPEIYIYKKCEIKTDEHNYSSLVNQVLPSCNTNGTKAHYTCNHCDKLFIKEGETYIEVDALDLVIEASHSYGSLINEVQASCENTGTKAHYYCEKCDTYFTKDKVETTLQQLIIPQSEHDLKTIEGESASCIKTGIKSHYQCKVCEKLFILENNEYKLVTESELVIEKENHKYGNEVKEEKATCEVYGKLAHYQCEVCEKLFILENSEYKQITESELVIEKIGHKYGDEVKEEKTTCEVDGKLAHYQCSECDQLFVKNDNNYVKVTQEQLVVKSSGHDYIKVNEDPATCVKEGSKEHYKCSRCDKVFTLSGSDYVEVDPASLVLSKVEHTYDNKCDTTCNTCNEEREVSEHKDFNKDGKCDHCGTQLEVKKDNTTRNIIFISIGGATLLGLLLLLILKLKK